MVMINMKLEKKHVFRNLDFETRDDYFDFIADVLYKEGYVVESYAQGLKDREKEFPTGLPLAIGVAIPHTDASYVKKDTFVVSTFKNPIEFGEMAGDEEDKVDVKLAIGIVMSNGEKHLEVLQNIIERIQDEQFVKNLVDAEDENSIVALFNEK